MAKQNGTTRSSQRSSSPSTSGSGSSAGSSTSGRNRRRTQAGKRPSDRGRARREEALRQHQQERGQEERSQRRELPRGTIAGAGAKAVETVRANPIPAAIAGAALTWLLVKNRERLHMPQMPDALTGIAETVRDSFSETAEATRRAVRGGMGSAAEAVKDGAASLAEYAQTGASTVGQAAKKGYERSREAVATSWDEHPLTVGLVLLAAGVAAGMMLPTPKSGAITRAAKGLTQRVTSTGEGLLESARELVSSSARAASREAKRQGLTADQITRKVKRVASAATS